MKMSGIGHINGPEQVSSLTTSRLGSARRGASGPAAAPPEADQVELSDRAQLVSHLKSLPDIRVDKVAQVRAAIERGDYETEAKVDRTVDGILDDLT